MKFLRKHGLYWVLVLSGCSGSETPNTAGSTNGGSGGGGTTSSTTHGVQTGGRVAIGGSPASGAAAGNWASGGTSPGSGGTLATETITTGGGSNVASGGEATGGVATGGTNSMSGAAAIGGTTAAGGTSEVSGGAATGGAVATGGSNAEGGMGTGGTSEASGGAATGGTVATGGSNAEGGMGTGGTSEASGGAATGGAVATGGSNAEGGMGTGGTSEASGGAATGGAVATGGSNAEAGTATGGTSEASGGAETGGTVSSVGGLSAVGGSDTGGLSSTGGNNTGGVAGGGPGQDGGPALLDDCTLLLRMDETAWTGITGEVLDSSGANNHGTAIGGATTTTAPAKFGSAGLFNGADYVSIPNSATLHSGSAFTISTWVYPTGLNGSSVSGMVTKRLGYGDGSEFTLFVWSGNHIYVDVDGEDDRWSSIAALTNNAWYHLAVVFDGHLPSSQRVSFYVNGELDSIHSESSTAVTASTAAMFVGNMAGADKFVGAIDDVAFWQRALSSTEVLGIYQSQVDLQQTTFP